MLYGISLPSHGTHELKTRIKLFIRSEFKKINNREGGRNKSGGGGWKILEKLTIGGGGDDYSALENKQND